MDNRDSIVSGYKIKYERTLSQDSPDRPYPQVVDFVEKYRAQLGKRVADLGSGNGRNLIYLSEQGFYPVGVELNPAGVMATKKHLQALGLQGEAVVGDINQLPLANQSYDSALSRRVFDYSDDVEALAKFKEASRILKPGGLMFLSVRSFEQASKENEVLESENQFGGKTYSVTSGSEQGVKQHYFSERELRDLAEKAGFEVVELIQRKYYAEKDGKEKFEFILEMRKINEK